VNVFTEKAGPLPVWAWMAIVTVIILGVVSLRKKSSSSTDNTAAQQQLGAEEAALANAAGQSAVSSGNGASTYGSGYGQYGGNGSGSWTAGNYSTAPAASDTTPVTTTAPAGGSGSTTTATAPAPAAVHAGAISNLQASGVTKSSATIRWNPDANNKGGYAYSVMKASNWPKGPAVKSGVTTGTSVTVSGLQSKTTYNFGVQGLPGGPGDNIHFTTT